MTTLDERVLVATKDVLAGKTSLPEGLDAISKGLGDSLLKDLKDRSLNDLWGFCQAAVVPRGVLQGFAAMSGLDYSESCAPSGIVHTYGYLLTAEDKPPHLTKRYRWTSGEISRFFGYSNSAFWSDSKAFLRSVTDSLLTLPGIDSVHGLAGNRFTHFSEVARFDEQCTANRWRSRWQVFENETSATSERQTSHEAHILVYQVGSHNEPLKLSTVFPVRRDRIQTLMRQHESDGPKLRFNACVLTPPLI